MKTRTNLSAGAAPCKRGCVHDYERWARVCVKRGESNRGTCFDTGMERLRQCFDACPS
jgi:hypothetical protein